MSASISCSITLLTLILFSSVATGADSIPLREPFFCPDLAFLQSHSEDIGVFSSKTIVDHSTKDPTGEVFHYVVDATLTESVSYKGDQHPALRITIDSAARTPTSWGIIFRAPQVGETVLLGLASSDYGFGPFYIIDEWLEHAIPSCLPIEGSEQRDVIAALADLLIVDLNRASITDLEKIFTHPKNEVERRLVSPIIIGKSDPHYRDECGVFNYALDPMQPFDLREIALKRATANVSCFKKISDTLLQLYSTKSELPTLRIMAITALVLHAKDDLGDSQRDELKKVLNDDTLVTIKDLKLHYQFTYNGSGFTNDIYPRLFTQRILELRNRFSNLVK